MTVWLVGAGGRTPFVGHLRGARAFGSVRLAWAGRVAGTASVVEGWEAAEAARDALTDLRIEGDLPTVLAAACAALQRLDARWLARGDMSVLLVAADDTGVRAAGAGLGAVFGRHALAQPPSGQPPSGQQPPRHAEFAWRPSVPAGHALLGEPGAPDGTSYPVPPAEVWVGVPVGLPFPARDVGAACGVHP
ncbi:MAG: hypothetical protein Q8P18_07105 [Pseudomonadota bacterium]|nr:hypothetical protein [Pseudomonadota bacterium]